MERILVIGASGSVGTELVTLLKQKGRQVIRATHKKDLASDQVHLNLVTKEGLESAFVGIDKVFLLSPPGYTHQDKLLIPLIEEAKKQHLKKVVLMTAMGANANEASPMRKVEVFLEKSGLAFNVIRPNWFMQNFNSYWIQGIRGEGKIFLPVAKAKGSFIDARDIAAVAAELLTTDQHSNKDFDLTGAESLDHDQVAVILSRVAGKTIVFQDIPSEAMLKNLLSAGLPQDYSEFLIMILGFFKEGYSERITPHVEVLTGRSPISFEQYAKDYRQHWM